MLRRLVAVLVVVVTGTVIGGLGPATDPAGAATPSPAPTPASASPGASNSAGASPTATPEPSRPPGPPSWLLIAIGVVIIIFAMSGGATRLAKRFQQPPPP